jgi:hypothetical protein
MNFECEVSDLCGVFRVFILGPKFILSRDQTRMRGHEIWRSRDLGQLFLMLSQHCIMYLG